MPYRSCLPHSPSQAPPMPCSTAGCLAARQWNLRKHAAGGQVVLQQRHPPDAKHSKRATAKRQPRLQQVSKFSKHCQCNAVSRQHPCNFSPAGSPSRPLERRRRGAAARRSPGTPPPTDRRSLRPPPARRRTLPGRERFGFWNQHLLRGVDPQAVRPASAVTQRTTSCECQHEAAQ